MSARARLAVALVLGLGIAGSGAALERWVGPLSSGEARRSQGESRAWFCPHGGGAGWRAWIALANSAEAEARVRLTTFGPEGMIERADEGLPPMSLRLVDVPAPEMAGATLVESFGGKVAAASGVARPGDAGSAAEPCAPEAARTWYVAGGTSERGRESWLVVLNPFGIDAAFEVTLTGQERALQPGPLAGVVLPAGRAAAFDLNEFALGERALAATVRASLGRVVVAGIGLEERGVRAAMGVPALARTWVFPAGAEDAGGSLGILGGLRETPFRVVSHGIEAQDVLTDVSVQPLRAGTFEVAAAGSLAVVSEGGGAFAAGRRLTRAGFTDEAAASGTPSSAARWVALPAGPVEGGPGRLILHNSGAEQARVLVTLLDSSGIVPAPALARVIVPPGQTEEIDLGRFGDEPMAAVVEASEGEVAAAQSAAWTGGFALSLGVPSAAR